MTPQHMRKLLEKDAERFHIDFGMLAPKLLRLWETAREAGAVEEMDAVLQDLEES